VASGTDPRSPLAVDCADRQILPRREREQFPAFRFRFRGLGAAIVDVGTQLLGAFKSKLPSRHRHKAFFEIQPLYVVGDQRDRPYLMRF